MAVTYQGHTLDQSTRDKIVLAGEWIGVTLTVLQGSYNTSVGASAGTHSGGGAADIECRGDSTATKVKKVKYLRAVGFAAWHRPYNWDGAGGIEHIHCEEIGNPRLAPSAKQQITQWNEGRNGLANQARDTDSVDVAAGRPARITSPPSPPAPSAGPAQLMGSDKTMIVKYAKKTPGKTYTWHGDFILSGGVLFHIVSVTDYNKAVAAGLPIWNVSYAQWLVLGGKA